MDLVTGQRTYCLGLSANTLAGTTPHYDVPFVDTAGNAIRCSYVEVSVMADGPTAVGIIAFELSGLVTEGNAVLNTLSAIASPNTSGVCGFNMVLGAVASTRTWHGSQNQIVTGVRILPRIDEVDNIVIAITYGNLYGLNSGRLAESYDAGV